MAQMRMARHVSANPCAPCVGKPVASMGLGIGRQVVGSCGLPCFDSCSEPIDAAAEALVSICPQRRERHERCQCVHDGKTVFRCSVHDETAFQGYLLHTHVASVVLTLCLGERHLVGDEDIEAPPTYTIITNDRTCGQLGEMLQNEFPDVSERIKLVNLDSVAKHPVRHRPQLSLGAASCARLRARGQLLLVLETSFQAPVHAVHRRLSSTNRSEALKLLSLVHAQPHPSKDLQVVTAVYCFCGHSVELPCPDERTAPVEHDGVHQLHYPY
eukprot:TRINITY_DN27414_c0_g1_i7.p1 TRINITY_DN27414_c0_g1~~TRINITY_DN27414_c0_g1_i7.p1  ORF type:complete len:271 (+),score=22.02 TRINITY_DN27414_c0_g1_i7:81-893(+)